jgi:hypothetical protein
MFFKTFTINNTRHSTTTTTIVIIILVITGLLSNIPLVYSQSTSEIQKNYKNFLKGETDWYDEIISAAQTVIQIIYNATK